GSGGRFWMLETIREYAGERFDESGVRLRHAQYFLMVAEELAPNLEIGVGDPTPWLDRMEADHDNFRGAFDFFDATGRVELKQRLAASLWRFWQVRGYYAEARRRLERALQGDGPSETRAQVAYAAGMVAGWSGHNARAERLLAEALGIFE